MLLTMKILTVLTCVVGVVFSAAYEVHRDPLVVHTKSGWVRGQYNASRGGRQIVEFLGIPYAKPPIGDLRFKSPQKADPWDGVFNATVECSACVQQNIFLESLRTSVIGSEDCLCVNVFTPDVSSKSKFSVIVWIVGGDYMALSSAKVVYGPELLLDQDVVLVTFNYRLGIMGFLTTGDSVIPPNAAMKDQVLALKWVKENIANFGGDPNSVTLFGESAGGCSVDLHQYSPLSAGLFHKTIQDSGSALSGVAMTKAESLKGRSTAAAEMVGCPTSPSAALLECMQKLPAESIVNTTHTFLLWDVDPVVIWAPSVEPFESKDSFLPEDPQNYKRALTKPLLKGFNKAEGAIKTTILYSGKNVSEKFAQWNAEFNTLLPISLLYNNTELDCPDVTKAIRKFYFGNVETITQDMLAPITDMYGDFWFIKGIIETAERQAGPTYIFHYNYKSKNSDNLYPTLFQSSANPTGANHLDELTNLFPMLGLSPKYDPTNSDPDFLLSVKMVELWTNFAKYSNPSTSDLKWEPKQTDALEYLDITNSGLTMKSRPLQERRQFWGKLTALAKACKSHA